MQRMINALTGQVEPWYGTCPVTRVVSIGRRNTKLEPTLHRKQKLESVARLDQPERYPG